MSLAARRAILYCVFLIFSHCWCEDVCLKGYEKVGVKCYKLAKESPQIHKKAETACGKLQNAKLPMFDNGYDFQEFVEYLRGKHTKYSSTNYIKFWLRKNQFETSLNFSKAPPDILYDQSKPNSDQCAIGFDNKKTKTFGVLKSRCIARKNIVGLDQIVTICELDTKTFTTDSTDATTDSSESEGRSLSGIHDLKNTPTVAQVFGTLSNLKLESGEPSKWNGVKLADIQKLNDLINKLNELTAKETGLKATHSNSPMRGDLFHTESYLQHEYGYLVSLQKNKKTKRMAPGNDPKHPQIQFWDSSKPITYTVENNYEKKNPKEYSAFKQALAHWQEQTCYSFERVKAKGKPYDFVLFDGRGCFSNVGKVLGPKDVQVLSLSRGCGTFAIAAHEIGHLLGFDHEQARPDRDLYVDTYVDNIDPSYIDNFRKCCECGNADKPYDYGSLMHYTPTAFAKTQKGNQTVMMTLLPKKPYYVDTMGGSVRPSFLDLKTLVEANCQRGCASYPLKCLNGGYRHPRFCETCYCPTGFIGIQDTKCGKVLTKVGATGTVVETSNDLRNITCTYVIQPINPQDVVQMSFLKGSVIDLPDSIHQAHLEIRTGNYTATGQKFCGGPIPNINFTAEGDRVIVTYRSTAYKQMKTYQGFKLFAWSIASVQMVNPTKPLNQQTVPQTGAGNFSLAACVGVAGAVRGQPSGTGYGGTNGRFG